MNLQSFRLLFSETDWRGMILQRAQLADVHGSLTYTISGSPISNNTDRAYMIFFATQYTTESLLMN